MKIRAYFSNLINKRIIFKQYDFSKAQIISEQFQQPVLDDGQFVAKVHYAPINPLDLLKIKGQVAQIKLPFTPGSECCGEILQTKNRNELIGKKVSFYVKEGSFRQYTVGDLRNAIILPDDSNLVQLACLFVNPLTCYGMYQTAVGYRVKAIINTAANSALGMMIYKLFSNNGIKVINLVRSKKRVKQMKEQGIENIIDIMDEQFESELSGLCYKLNVGMCLDCYSGELASKILKCMPEKSLMLTYGNLLSPHMEKLNSIDLRWQQKELKGFSFFLWAPTQSEEQLELIKQDIVKKRNKEFETQINGIYGLEKFTEALYDYQSNMSAGKILIKFV